MELTARLSTEGDTGAVSELRAQARAELAGVRGGDVLLAGLSSGDNAPPGALSAVAELEGVVIGYLTGQLLWLADGMRLLQIAELYVDPGAREVGAGEALLRTARLWALEQGASGIDVGVLPGAREAKNFFESSGLTARLIVMHERFD